MSPGRRPGTPRLLRALNDRAALELLLAHGPLTRAQLGEFTGLSKVTASQLVERLEQRGLVEHVGSQAGGRGPNALLYALVPDAAFVVGADIGPTRVIAAAADITGKIVGQVTMSTRDADDPVGVVHEAVTKALGDAPLSRLRRVVLGTPGLVDPATGDLSFAWDLPHWQRGLLAALREDLGVAVGFENDVNLAAVAESRLGAAVGTEDFALVWVDRGVGLASMIGGRLHRGVTGAAGEIGYLPVPGVDLPHGESLREQGAFQRLVGAEAVAGVTDKAELARRLALGVAATCVVLDPSLVVLGGTIAREGGSELAELVRREVRAIAPIIDPQVVISAVPEEPVLHGALLTAVDAAREEVFDS
ncbi:ROK family transcriptional regulator [Longispora albida]|uniref:ROK family transcriptional regulator n=1 Tax=Longispora albida TaxID=203523 RepID=UPI0003761586|nr:ROK family transcriptional regulator [Longispora albida]